MTELGAAIADAAWVADTSCVALTDRPFDQWALQVWPELSDLLLTNGVSRPT